MTTYHGKNGVVRVNGVAVAEVQNFKVTTQVTTVDATAMNADDETHLPGVKSWSGSLEYSLDPADPAQNALVEGASIALDLYPSTTVAGQRKLSGTATVTQGDTTIDRSQVNKASCSFKGNGPLARSTI